MLTDQMDYISMLKILHQSGSIFLQQHFRTILLENNSVFPLVAVLSYDSQCPSGENPDKYMHQLADDEIERVDDSSQVKKKSTQKDGKKKASIDETKRHSFFVYPQKVEL